MSVHMDAEPEVVTRRMHESADAYVSTTKAGVITGWNDAAVALFGWSAEYAVGKVFIDLVIVPEQRKEFHARRQALLANPTWDGSARLDFEAIDRMGRTFPAAMSVATLHTADGLSLHCFISETSLRTSPAIGAIFAHSAEAIVTVASRERLISEWNPAAQQMFGWTREEMIGRPIDVLVPPHLLKDTSVLAKRVHRHGEPERIQTQRLRRDGSLIDVEVTMVLVHDESGVRRGLCMYRDISAAKEAERRLASLTSQLHAMSLAERAAVASCTQRDGDAKSNSLVERVVGLACELVPGIEFAWLAEIVDRYEVFRVLAGDSDAFGMHEGATMPLSGLMRNRMVHGETSYLVRDALTDPELAKLPAVSEQGLRAFVAVPVVLSNGRVYGTLGGAGRHVGTEIADRDLRLLRELAQVLADEIEEHRELSLYRSSVEAISTLNALLAALAARDQYTGAHSEAVVDLSRAVARHLGLDPIDIEAVAQTALLHDIGKVGIPDSILLKEGPLTELEWDLMREHPAIGARIIAGLRPLAHLAPAIRAEHERWDGAGYPDGLAGEQIPVSSRITFTCDAYHAMISDRAYRKALGHEVAVQQLRENAGGQFDPVVVAALIDLLER